jgi:multisubunit Na+/H+ antiporter MnhB subunit
VEREQQITAIVDAARRTRRPTSRAMWIVAGAVGAVCAIAFVVAMLVGVERAPAGTPVPPDQGSPGLGFSGGLTLGLGVGIVIGFLIARRHVSAHSSRSRP